MSLPIRTSASLVVSGPLGVKRFHALTEVVGLPQPAVTMPLELDRGREHSILGVVEQLPQPIGRPTRGGGSQRIGPQGATWARTCALSGKWHGHGGLRRHRACGAHSGYGPGHGQSANKATLIAWSRRSGSHAGVRSERQRGSRDPARPTGCIFILFLKLCRPAGRLLYFAWKICPGSFPLTPLEPARCRCGPRRWLRALGGYGRGSRPALRVTRANTK
jgi:hypothetical protein